MGIVKAISFILVVGGAALLTLAWVYVKNAVGSRPFPFQWTEVTGSVFLWIASTTGFLIWSAETVYPQCEKFFNTYPNLRYLLPYFLGSGLASWTNRGDPGKIVGSILLGFAAFLLFTSYSEYNPVEPYVGLEYRLSPNGGSTPWIILENGQTIGWSTYSRDQSGQLYFGGRIKAARKGHIKGETDWIFRCNYPWHSMVTKADVVFFLSNCEQYEVVVKITELRP